MSNLTFCSHCGLGVMVDEDGCCVMCGCDAMGQAVDAIFAQLHDSETDLQRAEEALEVAREALTKIAESDFDLEHNFSDYDTLCALVFPALNRIGEIMGEQTDE